jgi:hypothetical protein
MPITLYREYLVECFNLPKLLSGIAKYELQTESDKQDSLEKEFFKHVFPKLKSQQ